MLRSRGTAHLECQNAHLPAPDRAKIQLAAADAAAFAGTYEEWHYRADFVQARELALGVAATESGTTTRLDSWRAEVRELLVGRAHEVVAVARALSDRYRLSGDELDQAIAGRLT